MMRTLACLGLCLAAALASACGDSTTTTSPSATTTATSTTEMFSGSLPVGGTAFYSFTVAASGDVALTLASTTTAPVGPAVPSRLMLGIGTPSGFGCTVTSSIVAEAGLTAQLTAPNAGAGIYCVSVADVEGLRSATSFVIRIVHT